MSCLTVRVRVRRGKGERRTHTSLLPAKGHPPISKFVCAITRNGNQKQVFCHFAIILVLCQLSATLMIGFQGIRAVKI